MTEPKYLAYKDMLKALRHKQKMTGEKIDEKVLEQLCELQGDFLMDSEMNDAQLRAIAFFNSQLFTDVRVLMGFQLGFQFGYTYVRRFGSPRGG
jgi:hypothetical protein